MSRELPPQYNPANVEDKIYRLWEESGFFNPDVCIKKKVTSSKAPVFSIVLPPPNVTGVLHLGHAYGCTIQDVMVRYHRMKGDRTLWLPGTDHAAIATQAKVEDILYHQEKKTRHDLGREAFLSRVEAFAQESRDTIVSQLKKLGASLDWSREAYTLDEARNVAVRTAFKRMYEDKLIYRGNRIVNWDPKLRTTVSDDEIEWKEEKTPFYYLRYGPFIIGTARPETKFGDKYVVMHPADKRYRQYKHGQQIELEWINGPIIATVIKDEAIDMAFGTGVMTITPWHDATDFEIAQRHNLDKEQIIDDRGVLLPIAGEFANTHIKKARSLIIEKLKSKGLVDRLDEEYIHRIATNSRGGGTIEPQVKEQWFIDVNRPFVLKQSRIKGIRSGQRVTLKELLKTTVKTRQITIIPRRFEKVYFSWIDNLRDWCISRQIWYGHRIPVWYKNGTMRCDIEAPKEAGWEQDFDTLDTWFSSGLWTFSTLGWPKQTADLKAYHPTSVLETGYDIIFFWVARMILMSGYLLGDVPFRNTYLHGLVRDEQGRKMSKSLGNIIDPLTMFAKYGADATRLALLIGAAPGNDLKISEDKIRGYRNFSNKLWNMARFILMRWDDSYTSIPPRYTPSDRKLLRELDSVKRKCASFIETYQFHHAAELLYHYTWHIFADKIIEAAKSRLESEDANERVTAGHLLLELYGTILRLLHPFMPFITEEIWRHLPSSDGSLLMITAHKTLSPKRKIATKRA